jgi:hypothetical protein
MLSASQVKSLYLTSVPTFLFIASHKTSNHGGLPQGRLLSPNTPPDTKEDRLKFCEIDEVPDFDPRSRCLPCLLF